jgi:hypothetical protein
VRQEVVHAGSENVHLYGGEVISRVLAFNARNDIQASPTSVYWELSSQMVAPNPHTLIQACLTEENEVVGHAVTMIQELFGYRTAMIYQLEIDDSPRDEDREQMLIAGFTRIRSFAEESGCQAIRAWAINSKLADVFSRFGFENKDFQFIEVKI